MKYLHGFTIFSTTSELEKRDNKLVHELKTDATLWS